MKNQERLLADIMILDARWAGAANGILLAGGNSHDIGDAVCTLSQVLIVETVRGEKGIGEVRQAVYVANGLDREAVELSGGSIESLRGRDHEAALARRLDYEEALARRIAHRTGRTALNALRSKERRFMLGLHLSRHRANVALGYHRDPGLPKFGTY